MSLEYTDGVDYVVQALKGRLSGGKIKTFYHGDPDLIPTFNLPAVLVTKTGDTTEPLTNAEDEVTEAIVVKLVLDKKDDWDNKTKPAELTETKMRDLMEGRDLETGRWREDTIRGALRTRLHSSEPYVGETTSLEYGVSVRPGGEADLVVAEAHLTVTVKYSVEVDQVFN